MAVFEIEQYEVYAQKHRIRAENEAEAIKWLLEGNAQPMDNELEFIEVCEVWSCPRMNILRSAEALQTLGVTVGDSVIPSIRSIEEVE